MEKVTSILKSCVEACNKAKEAFRRNFGYELPETYVVLCDTLLKDNTKIEGLCLPARDGKVKIVVKAMDTTEELGRYHFTHVLLHEYRHSVQHRTGFPMNDEFAVESDAYYFAREYAGRKKDELFT